MSDGFWDNPQVKPESGEFFKFANVGDTITGYVTALQVKTWPDGSASPQLVLDTPDADGVVVTCGQTQLKAKLHEQRPAVGDQVYIKFTEEEKRQGGKTLKHFDVRVKKVEAKPVAASDAPF